MTEKTFKALFEKAKKRDSYWIGKAIQDFTEDLYRLMEARGVNKAELARRINSTPAYVTKVLRGNTNFTIESMVRLVHALDGELSIHVERREANRRWFDVAAQRDRPYDRGSDHYRPLSELSIHESFNDEVAANDAGPIAA